MRTEALQKRKRIAKAGSRICQWGPMGRGGPKCKEKATHKVLYGGNVTEYLCWNHAKPVREWIFGVNIEKMP